MVVWGRIALRLVLATFLVAEPHFATAAQDAPVIQPDAIEGVRTKWEHIDRVNERYSVPPDLVGLTLQEWMRALEAEGLNTADLNLDPRTHLARTPKDSPEELAAYIAALRVPEPLRSPAEAARIARWRDIVATQQYTPEERDAILLDFLAQLDVLRRTGAIQGNVRFILHQRQWLRPGGSAKRAALRSERAEDFATDMANFINRARAEGVDGWISGVRLGENANPNMDELLPALIEIARDINRQTDGWLRGRLFLSNGGGMGSEFAGLTDPATGFTDFLAGISVETGTFAFGYKWMQRAEDDNRFIKSVMETTLCDPGRACDRRSVADWTTYLSDTLGFDELVSSIAAYHDQYPDHANVIFVGDSSDALTLMVNRRKDGSLVDGPQLIALRYLWPRTEGWQGKLFMNGFLTADMSTRLKQGATPDIGMGFFFYNGNALEPLPQSIELFQAWPESPPEPRSGSAG